MTRQTIKFATEQEWLEMRKHDITSTMSSALFGLSPYQTEFEIWQAKKHGVDVEFEASDRMDKGNRMESAIAHEAALQEGWTDLKPFKTYVRMPDERIASSFDFEAIDKDGNSILIEIKAVDYFQYKEKWIDNEAPPHIEIQCQHELLVADRFERVAIVACTGIYDYNVIYRDRDIAMGNAIIKRVAKFWSDVENDIEPEIDFERDANVINAMFPDVTDDKIDLTDDVNFEDLLRRFDLANSQKKEFDTQAKALKAEIHHTLGDAGGAYTETYRIVTGRTKDNPGRAITQDQVGTIVGKRKGYRQCLLTNTQKT